MQYYNILYKIIGRDDVVSIIIINLLIYNKHKIILLFNRHIIHDEMIEERRNMEGRWKGCDATMHCI